MPTAVEVVIAAAVVGILPLQAIVFHNKSRKRHINNPRLSHTKVMLTRETQRVHTIPIIPLVRLQLGLLVLVEI